MHLARLGSQGPGDTVQEAYQRCVQSCTADCVVNCANDCVSTALLTALSTGSADFVLTVLLTDCGCVDCTADFVLTVLLKHCTWVEDHVGVKAPGRPTTIVFFPASLSAMFT